MFNYWEEALISALDDLDTRPVISDDQIKQIAKSLKISAEMESESMGYLEIPNPLIQELKETKAKAEKESWQQQLRINKLKDNYNALVERVIRAV